MRDSNWQWCDRCGVPQASKRLKKCGIDDETFYLCEYCEWMIITDYIKANREKLKEKHRWLELRQEKSI